MINTVAGESAIKRLTSSGLGYSRRRTPWPRATAVDSIVKFRCHKIVPSDGRLYGLPLPGCYFGEVRTPSGEPQWDVDVNASQCLGQHGG